MPSPPVGSFRSVLVGYHDPALIRFHGCDVPLRHQEEPSDRSSGLPVGSTTTTVTAAVIGTHRHRGGRSWQPPGCDRGSDRRREWNGFGRNRRASKPAEPEGRKTYPDPKVSRLNICVKQIQSSRGDRSAANRTGLGCHAAGGEPSDLPLAAG
jgi:hypothetical protein